MTSLAVLILVTSVGAAAAPRQAAPAAAAAAEQRGDTRSKADEILAAFNRRKHKVKEKRGVRLEMYKEVRSEPAERADPSAYSGRYVEPDLGSAITLRVSGDGRVEASGAERCAAGAPERRFAVEDAAVDGALLTGTKVYEDGARERVEGLFVELTVEQGPSPERIERRATSFGLAFVGPPREVARGLWREAFFYERVSAAPPSPAATTRQYRAR